MLAPKSIEVRTGVKEGYSVEMGASPHKENEAVQGRKEARRSSE